MYLKSLELAGFKSFAKKATLSFTTRVTGIVGPNGSGKSNVVEAFRFALGEQRMTQMRGKRTEDLIWNGSPKTGKSNKASVTLTFDNSRKLFDVDFDEVALERVIHRDSSTDYKLNVSPVRLKDIVELLAGAHIGASGHHIISQGETDRILSVNVRDRREMIEDALGLKIFQYKKEESVRRLEHTEANMKEVASLRREVKPHLKFLEGQVKKIEKVQVMRADLEQKYQRYFAHEEAFVSSEKMRAEEQIGPVEKELDGLDKQHERARKQLEDSSAADEKSGELLSLEKELASVRAEKDTLSRALGRIEGQISAMSQSIEANGEEVIASKDVRTFVEDVLGDLSRGDGLTDISSLRGLLGAVVEKVRSFLTRVVDGHKSKAEKETETLRGEEKETKDKFKLANSHEKKLEQSYQKLQKAIEEDKESSRDAERSLFKITEKQNKLRTELSVYRQRQKEVGRFDDELTAEKKEAEVLSGSGALSYTLVKKGELAGWEGDRAQARKDLERLKIRLEDAGGGSGEEVLREYEEVSDRDQHLERELIDLETSATSLKQLIVELDDKLRNEFRDGLEHINKHFQELFSIMFGGGTANLRVVKERTRRQSDLELARLTGELEDDGDEVFEEGVEVQISLPRKKIRGLQMLSGGERALTSIALLFAMSQVNPPPFLVLDETDAALDEANSRRYGDMIERLAKDSQLILITHNRETMSRAGVLYGVTMGGDGASQLLSVSFDEAVQVAK